MTVEIRVLEERDRPAAFALATRVFIGASTLHRALGIGLEEYRAYLRPSFDAMADEGLSVVAQDRSTGALLGCVVVTDFHGQLNDTTPPPKRFAPLSALTRTLCDRYREVRMIEAGQVALVDMAAVSPDATGHGLYRRMRQLAHRHARIRGFQRVAGELSSAATQRVVLDSLGHQRIADVAYDRFRFDGAYPFRTIQEPESIVLAEGDL